MGLRTRFKLAACTVGAVAAATLALGTTPAAASGTYSGLAYVYGADTYIDDWGNEGILSTGVGFTAVLAAWWLKERLSNPAKLAVVVMMAGLVLLSLSAAPETGDTLGLPLAVIGLTAGSLLLLTIALDRVASSRAIHV